MTDRPPTSVREGADELGLRLGRIGAAAVTLRTVTADLRPGASRQPLIDLLDDVARDLALASRQVAGLRGQAAGEIERPQS